MDIISAGTAQLVSSLPSPHRILQLPFFLNSFRSYPETLSHPESQVNVDSSISLQSTCESPSLSCSSNLPSPVNTCCLNHPSGHFLLAQFWDTSPPLGPKDSWTLHGLWPDYCTGGYPAFCDGSRDLNGHEIAGIVNSAAKTTHPDLESYMNTYWKGLHGDDGLWSHEWNKHGTCISTLKTKCYDDDNDDDYVQTTSRLDPAHVDLLDYLSAATILHSTLDTYSLLASHGIVPSYTATYTLSQITNALTSHPTWTLLHPLATNPQSTHPHTSHHASSSSLFTATIKCHRGAIDEIWMHFTTAGHLRNTTATNVYDRFVPAAPDKLGRSTCPQTGIKYLPKNAPLPGPTGTHTAPVPGPTSTSVPKPFEGRGFLNVHVLDTDYDVDSATIDSDAELGAAWANSCLIRRGDWFTSGQCARYVAKTDVNSPSSASPDDHLFTLTSSFAPCGIKDGRFVCAAKLDAQDIFSASAGADGQSEGERNVLTWRNQTVFYADHVPGRFEKVGVFTDDGEGQRAVEVEIRWEAA